MRVLYLWLNSTKFMLIFTHQNPPPPPNPGNNVPETQVSGGGQPQTTAEDVIVIPETQMPKTSDNTNPTGTGKKQNYIFYKTTVLYT